MEDPQLTALVVLASQDISFYEELRRLQVRASSRRSCSGPYHWRWRR